MITPFIKNNVDSIIAAIIGFIVIQLFTSYDGIGISPDSIVYTSVARNLIAGNGFTDYLGCPLVLFPLFYPFFLAVVMFITQTDIVTIAPILNGLIFAMLIFLSGAIVERFKYKTNWYKRIILAIMICSPSLIQIYTMLWSETLFILLIIVFIFSFQRYFKTHNYTSLMFAATIAAIAFDTRYAGVSLVGAGCLLIFFDKNLNWKKKSIHIFLFGGVGVSLIILNLIKNIIEDGLGTGMRQEGITPLSKNIEYSGNVFSDWFTFQYEGHLFFEILAIAVMIFFVVFFIRNLRHWKAYYTLENVAISFFIVYVLCIIVTSTISRYETINNRLLAPAFIPLLWISTCQIPKWRKRLKKKSFRWLFFAFSLGVAIVLIGSYIAINKKSFVYVNEKGIPGYSEDIWKKSQLIRYLQKHNEIFENDSTIYSNHNQAVYFLTGHTIITLPEPAYKEDVEEFEQMDSGILIWFNLEDNPGLLSLREIQRMKKMELIKSFPDGEIFLLKNKKK